MRRRKKAKTIDDISVEKLFDDFVHVHSHEDSKRVNDIDDDEYVSMMLKKDAPPRCSRWRAPTRPSARRTPCGYPRTSRPASTRFDGTVAATEAIKSPAASIFTKLWRRALLRRKK